MNKHLFFVVAEVENGTLKKVETFHMDHYLEEAFPIDKPQVFDNGSSKVYGMGILSDRNDEQEMFKKSFLSAVI